MNSCPWCGKTLTDNPDRCDRCKWTRKGYNMRPAIIAYSFFVLLSIILGIVVFQWVRRATKDVDTKALGAFIDIRKFEEKSWR